MNSKRNLLDKINEQVRKSALEKKSKQCIV